MSEHTTISYAPTIIYAFKRADRHRLWYGTKAEAVSIPHRATVTTLRTVYRDLLRAGVLPAQARLDVWLLVAARTSQISVERVTL